MKFRILAFAALMGMMSALAAPHAKAQTEEYGAFLRPGDILRISVWPDSGLGGEFVVEETGEVNVPFLGAVTVSGVPIATLRSQLREGYSEATRNAVVTVMPLFRVGVTGSVRRPGAFWVPPTDGFFDVIAAAGGFDIRAKEDQVSVVRDGQVIKLNARDAIERGETLPFNALSLRSGDQIIVPFGAEPWGARDWIALGNFAISLILLWDRLAND